MNPNIRPMFRGSKLVPSNSPSEGMVTQAGSTTVTITPQCSDRWASTPLAWTTEAMGRTSVAEMGPWTAPDSTLAMATSQIGHGACTRSSISRV